jgi:hypothetical protein
MPRYAFRGPWIQVRLMLAFNYFVQMLVNIWQITDIPYSDIKFF